MKFMRPTNKKEAENYIYGSSINQTVFNTECCAYEVWDGHLYHQCKRKPGHGSDAIFCYQHVQLIKQIKTEAMG